MNDDNYSRIKDINLHYANCCSMCKYYKACPYENFGDCKLYNIVVEECQICDSYKETKA